MNAPDLEQDYQEAGFGVPLGFGDRAALVVVDFVQAYLDQSSPLYAGVEDALGAARTVLEAARAAEILRIFTVVEYQADGADGGVFYRKIDALKVYWPGSPLGEIAPDLKPVDGEIVITKQYPSAFFGTSLASTLAANQIDTVIVVGLSTSGCIRATVVDAVSHGFVPIVVSDAVGDRDARPHEASLFDMAAKYADVLPSGTVVSWLQDRPARSGAEP
jgi:maleamate amidohydrolase